MFNFSKCYIAYSAIDIAFASVCL